MNFVKINKSGTFYTVTGDDAYILYYLFNYSIKNDKCGFPKSAFNKVINTLEDSKISYELINEKTTKDFKKLNRYQYFKDMGFKKYNMDIHYANLLDKIRNIDESKLNKILEAIEDIINE